MATFEEFKAVKYGDYLKLKGPSPLYERAIFGRVVAVNDPGIVYVDKNIIWVHLGDKYKAVGNITWTFTTFSIYVEKIITSEFQKSLIKNLFDS